MTNAWRRIVIAGFVAVALALGFAQPAAASSWPVVRVGATGANVIIAQYLLRDHGHALSVDGDFGPATERVVVSFQQSRGYSADGVIGAQTWGGLIVTVSQGSGGDAVSALQVALNKFGFALVIDGRFGPATAAAVRGFQRDHGLVADGIVGPMTWEQLISLRGVGCPVPGNADDGVLRTVYQTATGLRVTDRVLLAAFETGVVESNMNNLPCGDRDSLGVFQQRPSQGWGTPAQIMDVAYAANSFLVRAVGVAAAHPDWTAGQVAQAVQVSAFPDRYDQAEGTARVLIARVRGLAANAA